MKRLVWIVAPIVLAYLSVGCSDDTATTEPGQHSDDFVFEMTVSDDHVSTLREVTFSLTATDHDGGHVDFEQLALDRRMVDDANWRSIEMSHGVDGNYHGNYTFVSSGEYEFRVMGMPHAGHMMEELHHFEETLHVERIHADAGGYVVAYESFPGHIHEGDSATLTFWVTEQGADTPVTELAVEGRCSESSGTDHMFSLTEQESGVYGGDHVVAAAGTTAVALLFEGTDRLPAVAEFTIEVAHVHGN